MNKILKQALVVSGVFSLIGCASAPYPCGEPNAGKCTSVTQNYDNSFQNYTNNDDLPSSSGGTSRVSGSSDNPTTKPQKVFNFKNYAQVPSNGAPLLSTPKMMRVWITPYTDNDNIYHDQYYEYMIVDRGSWNFNNNQNLLNEDTSLVNTTPAQVSNTRSGGYGAYGLSDKPIPAAANQSIPPTLGAPNLAGFPALNMMQNGQPPVELETHVGSGIDTTTTLLP